MKLPPLANAQGSARTPIHVGSDIHSVDPQRNPDRQEGEQTITYLITWSCFGSWLPGQGGAVPRTQNQFNSPLPEPNVQKERHSRNRMPDAPYMLDEVRRQLVL